MTDQSALMTRFSKTLPREQKHEALVPRDDAALSAGDPDLKAVRVVVAAISLPTGYGGRSPSPAR